MILTRKFFFFPTLQYDKLVLLNEKQAIDRSLTIMDKKINAKLPTIKDLNESKRKADHLLNMVKDAVKYFLKLIHPNLLILKSNDIF